MAFARDRLYVALDVDDLAQAEMLMDQLQGEVTHYKLGAHLLAAEGPKAVRAVQRRGGRVFYDAKFHDIPNTVGHAVAAACRLGVAIVNVHASGGLAMMRAAAQAAAETAERQQQPKALVLGVTVLTSLDEAMLSDELGIARKIEDHVVRLAQLAQAAGLDGVVASPQELSALRRACGPKFNLLTPGIRPSGAPAGDQQRVQTPGEAIRAGADFLVVGRPIIAALDPRAAARAILQEMEGAVQ